MLRTSVCALEIADVDIGNAIQIFVIIQFTLFHDDSLRSLITVALHQWNQLRVFEFLDFEIILFLLQ